MGKNGSLKKRRQNNKMDRRVENIKIGDKVWVDRKFLTNPTRKKFITMTVQGTEEIDGKNNIVLLKDEEFVSIPVELFNEAWFINNPENWSSK